MPKQLMLVEVLTETTEAFALHAVAVASMKESETQLEKLAAGIGGAGVDIDPEYPPLPMFAHARGGAHAVAGGLRAFSSPTTNKDLAATSTVLTAEIDSEKIAALRKKKNVRLYPASRLHLMTGCQCGGGQSRAPEPDRSPDLEMDEFSIFDIAPTAGGIDCRPFRPGVSVTTIRRVLGVRRPFEDGFAGQNVIVGVVDEGINGLTYPVIGGYEPLPSSMELRFGEADIGSHGSMCAADILVAAPRAKLLDYPLLSEATSADGAQMFQLILERRRLDGTPQVVNNSYGFVGIPSREDFPTHEVWDIDHPFNRKVREVAASGASVFFAAGNCGSDCPSGNCRSSGIGPGRSINAAASMIDVFTIAAVNSRNERVGYSAQGPSNNAPGFVVEKPDFASYTHFFGNFGPGRPGGTAQSFDNGTSAATPVASGVAALLISAFPTLTPERLRKALLAGAIEVGAAGWDPLHGHGIINAGASYQRLRSGEV